MQRGHDRPDSISTKMTDKNDTSNDPGSAEFESLTNIASDAAEAVRQAAPTTSGDSSSSGKDAPAPTPSPGASMTETMDHLASNDGEESLSSKAADAVHSAAAAVGESVSYIGDTLSIGGGDSDKKNKD